MVSNSARDLAPKIRKIFYSSKISMVKYSGSLSASWHRPRITASQREAAAQAVELVPLSELLPKDWKGAEER